MLKGIRKILMKDGKGRITVGEEPIIQPKQGEVLVKVMASMISPGSELTGVISNRENPTDMPGKPFGYSNAGVVIEQGDGCEDIPIGTRVAGMGSGYAEHATHSCIPKNLVVPIPENVSFEHASSIHLVATGLNAIRRAELELGENVAVVGLGPVGQSICQWTRLCGCHTVALDRLPLRLERAVTGGVHQSVNVEHEDPILAVENFCRGYGLDAGIIAFGGDATEAFKMLVQMMKRAPDTHQMGRIVIVGGAFIAHRWSSSLGNLDIRSASRTGPGYHDRDWEHGAHYPQVFVQWSTRRNLEECIRFMDSGDFNVEPIVTHRVPIEDAPEVCEILIQRPNEALGVVLTS